MTYLTVSEASNYLKVPRSVLYSLWKELGGAKVGRHIRISREKIDEYMAGQKDPQVVCQGQTRRQISQPRPGLQQKGRSAGSRRTAEAIIKAGEDPHCPRNLLRSLGGIPQSL